VVCATSFSAPAPSGGKASKNMCELNHILQTELHHLAKTFPETTTPIVQGHKELLTFVASRNLRNTSISHFKTAAVVRGRPSRGVVMILKGGPPHVGLDLDGSRRVSLWTLQRLPPMRTAREAETNEEGSARTPHGCCGQFFIINRQLRVHMSARSRFFTISRRRCCKNGVVDTARVVSTRTFRVGSVSKTTCLIVPHNHFA
jgi:hypothetical protein